MSIQGFLSDKSLIDTSIMVVNPEQMTIPCGYLDRDSIEYFVQPAEIIDYRDSRLSIIYRRELTSNIPDDVILNDELSNILNRGLNHLQNTPGDDVTMAQYSGLDYTEFDNDILPTDATSISIKRELKLTFDYTKVVGNDLEAITNMSDAERGCFFNVVEYLLYGTLRTDTFSDINSFLANDPVRFGNYVTNSIKVNNLHTITFLYGGVNIHRFVPKSISFSMIINNLTVDMKLWIDVTSFRDEYPISTIINIVPPLELHVLLDPSSLSDPLDAAILSKTWSDTILSPEISIRDQSGMYLFATRYLYNGKTYQITFGLVYRGRVPDALEARQYIANYLLSSGIGTRALWEQHIPDVFYHSSFLLVPFYDDVTVLTNGDVYPSIISLNTMVAKLNSVVTRIPRAIDTTRELMTAAYDTLFIGVAPADINEVPSLLELHPTYRDFSTTDPGFSEMTADDREWSIKLNQALSVAVGGTNLLSMSIVESGNLHWVNFVFNYASFLVLTKASFIEHFNS